MISKDCGSIQQVTPTRGYPDKENSELSIQSSDLERTPTISSTKRSKKRKIVEVAALGNYHKELQKDSKLLEGKTQKHIF